jgi:hypothetical protein
LTPFLGSAQNVYYAVVPWLAYPLAGAVFGSMMARSTDRTALFRRGGAVGLVLLVVGSVLIIIQRPGFDVFTYWRQPLSFAVAIFGIILLWLALCDFATRRRRIDARLGILYGWSNRVIAIYFTHWIIVGWGVGLVGFRALGPRRDGRGRRGDQLSLAVRRPARIQLVAPEGAEGRILGGRGRRAGRLTGLIAGR